MNSDNIKTYAVGNGEITLSDTDAEELRIILQTEHVRNVMASIVHDNINDLNLPGKRCERSLVDWLTKWFSEYITIDPETHLNVIEAAEDVMFGKVHDLGWCDHPDTNVRLDEEGLNDADEPDGQNKNPPHPSEERLEIIAPFIEIFEDFLDDKGIVIENDEKEQSESPSNIYGTDWGNLCDRIEAYLINLGVLEGT